MRRDRVTSPADEPETTASATQAAGPAGRKRVRKRDRAAVGLLVLLVLVGIGLATLYLNRKAAARAVLVGWLDQRGIVSEVSVERLEIDGFTGRIRIGDPKNPDVVVEKVEVDYALVMPWSRGGLGVRPGRIRLVRPVMRASYLDGKFSLGSLDPLVEEFTGAPPRPDSRGPVVVVEGGRLNLATDYGAVQVRADAEVNDGKLMRLNAELPASALKSDDISARGLAARLNLATTGDRVTVALDASAEGLTAGKGEAALGGEAVTLRLSGDLPYPDLKTRRGDGRARIDAVLNGRQMSAGGAVLRDAALELGFVGQTRGWIEDFGIEGDSRLALTAAGVDAPGLGARGVRLNATQARTVVSRGNDGLGWSLTGPVALTATSAQAGELQLEGLALNAARLEIGGRDADWEATGPLGLTATRGAFGDLSLKGVAGRADLDATQTRGVLLIRSDLSLKSSGGAWPLLGPVASDDVAEMAAMKRALGDFAVDLPGLRLLSGSAGTEVVLTQPARITPRNGGVLTLRPAERPLYAARPGDLGGGALSLVATRGQGLPEATVDIPDWRLTPGGFEARLKARAALDFDVARGIVLDTSGLLISDRGVTTYAASGCTPFTVERLELGENDVDTLKGSLCAIDRPLVELREGGWRADGTLSEVAANAPFLEARFEGVEGSLAVTGAAKGIGVQTRIASARIIDTAAVRRFHPLTATGTAVLANDAWTGAFDVKSGDQPVATVALRHDGPSEKGGVSFDTGDLVFNEPGLQPHDLTPLVVEAIQSPVRGQVRFTGRFDWDPAVPLGSSSGRLVIPGIDFASPAGPVQGLKGQIDFTSLAPLTTAEGQTLTVDRLETVTPLTALGLTFTLGEAALKVEGGQIQAAGGVLKLEPLSVPLDGKQAFDGVIALDRVQLGELIASAGFADKVQLDAVVSGRLPFRWDPVAGVQVQAGNLTAVQPGRVSIQRDALTGLEAAGGGAEVPPSTVEDLAYQAMENLAFDSLTADVNSLEAGRVGVLFHIKGRHDPPERQELRLSISDLISRKFLERTLPLPSDTGIDLTLDTSLNLNELVQDILAARRPPPAEGQTP